MKFADVNLARVIRRVDEGLSIHPLIRSTVITPDRQPLLLLLLLSRTYYMKVNIREA